ncbi:MAG: methionine--tRNA ligase subunit beta, partial [Acutalibacteraceae bacterium]|nr:methionine--tRNA ligase subunit beta [Acutalibacteraceae bacterium]
FARIDTEKALAEIAAETEAKAKAAEKAENVATLEQISIEDFCKVELKAAKITACEPIKKAKKLLKLTLDDGSGKDRTVASGIALYYTPNELIGKTVIVVANLKPATLCGVESAGMILAAEAGDGVKVVFLDGVEPGAKIR